MKVAEKNIKETWIEAEDRRHGKAFIGEDQPNRWEAELLRLSKWEAKTYGFY